MNQIEWVASFRANNGREPSQAEFQAALQRGDFFWLDPNRAPVNNQAYANQAAPKRKIKTSSIVWLSLLAVFLLLVLPLAAFVTYYYYSGTADGVWEASSYRYYDEQSDKWENGLNSGDAWEFHNFLEIDSNYVKEYSYYYIEGFSEDAMIYPMNYFKAVRRINPWTRKLDWTLSEKSYIDMVERVYDDYYRLDSDQFSDEYSDNYREVRQQTYAYTKKGNQLEIRSYDKAGKMIAKIRYEKLSTKKATKLLEDYQDIEDKFKKKYSGLSDL